ncbi:MAG: hypothetical protein HN353_09350 [Bdellovibrionales bacterium]|jgi:hypothetical protein|nr:hypothetical protein [Bdellovibrionales bacterium]MBT3527338.1 hypothetical protein [Bdellovibrionales bacterium]MBT7767302.1 hypothetical protein [Bdellovibrionales bacterium]
MIFKQTIIIHLMLMVIAIYSLASQANTSFLPRSLVTVDQLIEEFRGGLTTKVKDLSSNYIATVSSGSIIFTSHEDVGCPYRPMKSGTTLAQVRLHVEQSEGRQLEVARYFACGGKLSLIEEVVTKGKNLTPVAWGKFIQGKRTFALQKGEDFRLYRLSNSKQQELFKVIIQRMDNGKVMNMTFFIRQAKFLTIRYQFEKSLTRAIFTSHGFKVSYHLKHSSWDIDTFEKDNRGFAKLVVNAYATPVGKVDYILNGSLMSQGAFQKFFQYTITRKTFEKIAKFIKSHLHVFPTTSFRQAGLTNTRFLDELKLAHIRLVNNTEINMVKDTVRQYIQAIEEGTIKIDDRRPKE